MTFSNISSATSFQQSGVGVDAEGQLALLALECEQTQQDAARDDKNIARQRFLDASDKEVAALRDEAHDILVGALVQGAATVTAASIQFGDALDEPCDHAVLSKDGKTLFTPTEKPWGEVSSAVVTGSGQAIGKALGDSAAANDRADGKRASTSAQQAQWKLDDAQKTIDETSAHQDKATDWLGSESANRASSEAGIISGFA